MSTVQSGMVIFAKDIHRVAEFYQSLLDLKLKHSDEEYVMLETSGLQLVIHKLPNPVAAAITIDNPPKRRSDTALKPIFFLADIDTARVLIEKYGGQLNSFDKEWEFDGHKTCDGHDPEGNVFQLRETTDKGK